MLGQIVDYNIEVDGGNSKHGIIISFYTGLYISISEHGTFVFHNGASQKIIYEQKKDLATASTQQPKEDEILLEKKLDINLILQEKENEILLKKEDVETTQIQENSQANKINVKKEEKKLKREYNRKK